MGGAEAAVLGFVCPVLMFLYPIPKKGCYCLERGGLKFEFHQRTGSYLAVDRRSRHPQGYPVVLSAKVLESMVPLGSNLEGKKDQLFGR